MHPFQSGSMRPFVRRDKTAVSGPSLPSYDMEPNVIIRKFTLQKARFCSEPEDKNVSTVSPQVVKDEGKKSISPKETLPSNQRKITIRKLEPPQPIVESGNAVQEVSENLGQLKSIVTPQSPKAVPMLLAKNTRLGMVGGKLVILQPVQGTQQSLIAKPPNATVYKKVKLTPSEDLQQGKPSNSSIEVLAVKPSMLSKEVLENQGITADVGLATPSKLVNTEAVLANGSKQSPTKSCQFKLETSGQKGCFIVPITSLNQSNNGEIVKLSTSPQKEVKVMSSTSGNQVLVKKSTESTGGSSAVTTPAESTSPQKKTVVFASSLKLADAPVNGAGSKAFMWTPNNSAEKTSGNIKYVTLPGHMLPKFLPGTKVYATAAVPQKSGAAAAVPASTADNKKVAAPTSLLISKKEGQPFATVNKHSAPKVPLVTQNQTSSPIELKVEVDKKGDVVGVTPARLPANEKMDSEKVKGAVHGSWALLQKRCNQAMELKRKVLQKEKYQIRVRKVHQKTITETDRGTQTSFFSLVEPGRLVEIQLEDENTNEGERVKEGSTGKSKAEKAGSHKERKSAAVKGVNDNFEPPDCKKSRTIKPVTVYDVLVQHNIQAMADKTAALNSEEELKHKTPKAQKSVPTLPPPSCTSPKPKSPDIIPVLDSPSSPNSSKLNTPEMRRQLLEDFTQCIQQDNAGNIPLHIAVLYEKIPLVKRHCALLTARKASLDIHNDDSETPLHMAVMLRNVEIIKMLLAFGASVSVTDSSGNTSLHLAVREGNEEVLNAILDSSKEELPLNVFNDEGLAPLHLCAQADKEEEARALLDKGADIDLKDAKSGRTPLFHAVERNAVGLVRMFLDLGANPNLPNFSGHTALLAANEYCDNPNAGSTDALYMAPKLRPLSAEDGPMVAALVGLSTDAESEKCEGDETITGIDER